MSKTRFSVSTPIKIESRLSDENEDIFFSSEQRNSFGGDFKTMKPFIKTFFLFDEDLK